MILKKLIYIIPLLFSLHIKAQVNIVPNPSFEDTIQCSENMTVSNPFTLNHNLKYWYTYKNMTPDYFNTCANYITSNPYPNGASIPYHKFGYQLPHIGEAYTGIGLYTIYNQFDSTNIYSEQLLIKLNSVLKSNTCYYGEFYVNFSNISTVMVNRIGMFFSQSTNTLVPYSFDNNIQPQIQWDTTLFFNDTLNWVKVSGTFTAQGGEEYLSIGNFRDGKHIKKQAITTNFIPPSGTVNPNFGAYVFVDDVALYELPQAQIGISNYTVCPQSDSLVLGSAAYSGNVYQWLVNGAPVSNQSQITVKPNVNTTYVLQTTACATSSQSFAVTYTATCFTPTVELVIPNVFSPNADNLNDVWLFSLGSNVQNVSCAIYNRWGNLIHSVTSRASVTEILWDGRTTSGEPCSEGVYFYTLKYTDANGEQQTKNGYVSLFR